jgi:hypothetical protein
MELGAYTPFLGTEAERLSLTDLMSHMGRLFHETDTGEMWFCTGVLWIALIVVDGELGSGSAVDGYMLSADGAGDTEWRSSVVIGSEPPVVIHPLQLWLDTALDMVLGTEEGVPLITEDGGMIGI